MWLMSSLVSRDLGARVYTPPPNERVVFFSKIADLSVPELGNAHPITTFCGDEGLFGEVWLFKSQMWRWEERKDVLPSCLMSGIKAAKNGAVFPEILLFPPQAESTGSWLREKWMKIQPASCLGSIWENVWKIMKKKKIFMPSPRQHVSASA